MNLNVGIKFVIKISVFICLSGVAGAVAGDSAEPDVHLWLKPSSFPRTLTIPRGAVTMTAERNFTCPKFPTPASGFPPER
jgi:hypothetical protein